MSRVLEVKIMHIRSLTVLVVLGVVIAIHLVRGDLDGAKEPMAATFVILALDRG